MGCFETEIYIIPHRSIRESLRYCRLIVPEDDNEYLETYKNNLIRSFIDEQV